MRIVPIAALLLCAPMLGLAQGPKPCEVLKAEIAKKIDARHVQNYTLEIVPKDQDAEGKVVGSCENGTKKIVYSKGTAAAKTAAPAKAAAPAPAKH